jgi:hypothetical protein
MASGMTKIEKMQKVRNLAKNAYLCAHKLELTLLLKYLGKEGKEGNATKTQKLAQKGHFSKNGHITFLTFLTSLPSLPSLPTFCYVYGHFAFVCAKIETKKLII